MNKIHYADRMKKWYQLRDGIKEEVEKQGKTLAIYDLPNDDLEIREFKGDSKDMILLCRPEIPVFEIPTDGRIEFSQNNE